jgi:hypothetical protein
MTSSTGIKKKYRKKFDHSSKNGSRTKRREFIDSDYQDGVKDQEGNLVIRKLNEGERLYLSNFYKEFGHATFKTSEESRALFRKINLLLAKNSQFYLDNGFYPVEIENLIQDFDKITKNLGNLHGFWNQKDINSDDYKRGFDMENIAKRESRCISYEDMQNLYEVEESENTAIEDLITESED